MERSTKFLSLSGLSGVVAGITALLGAGFAYFSLFRDSPFPSLNTRQELLILLADALIVLLISIGCSLFFCWKKAKKSGTSLFNQVTYRALYSFSIPLITGGLFCLIYLFRGDLHTVLSATLVFYGLALVNASRHTYGEIHYLGLIEIVLGLSAALWGCCGMLFWSLGFGVCHIIYGIVMYRKYDR